LVTVAAPDIQNEKQFKMGTFSIGSLAAILRVTRFVEFIFASWAIIYFGRYFFKNAEAAKIFGYFFQ
jgi:hypothetical protein